MYRNIFDMGMAKTNAENNWFIYNVHSAFLLCTQRGEQLGKPREGGERVGKGGAGVAEV